MLAINHAAARRTVTLSLSEAAINRHSKDPGVQQLKDTSRPVLLRYRKNRSFGTWYLVTHNAGKTIWKKMGNWPALPVVHLFAALPQIMARLAIDPATKANASGWVTVAQVLSWHTEHACHDRSLSSRRKDSVRSVVKCHLMPRIGPLALNELTKSAIDSLLISPLQATYSLAYVRQVWGVLAVAFNHAWRLEKISINPMAGLSFTTFVKTTIKPKAAALRSGQVADVLNNLAKRFTHSPSDVALAVMMLCHGTRLGETRQARWSNISADTWFIPAIETKTKSEHQLPITEQVRAFLARYRATQQAAGYVGAYLFPATEGRPLNEKQASEVFQRLGVGEWTSHDLRKVARSTWADLGVDFLVGETLLNHSVKGVVAAYIHTGLQEQKRTALNCWHTWLDTQGFTALHT
jgi:integrase